MAAIKPHAPAGQAPLSTPLPRPETSAPSQAKSDAKAESPVDAPRSAPPAAGATITHLVKHDLDGAAAKLEAEQVRQLLAAETRSIANSAPQVMLRLFRS